VDNTRACCDRRGTTGVRSRAVFVDGAPCVYRDSQHFPQPGWVEHDATEIWQR
jgi:glycerol kinase